MHRVLWVITGAGMYLRELVDVFRELKLRGIKVSVFATKWGWELARIYGVRKWIKEIAGGGYYEELLVDDEAFYYLGRISLRRYDVVVIAPATSNTIAKIACGIADTPASAAFSQALKSDTPVVLLPSDLPSKGDTVETELPCYINRGLCRCIEDLGICPAMDYCPVDAIVIVDRYPRIDLSRCIGCSICVDKCRYNAIRCWEKAFIKPSPIDLQNIRRLEGLDNVHIVDSPEDLINVLIRLLGRAMYNG